jgi:hypothetical protein
MKSVLSIIRESGKSAWIAMASALLGMAAFLGFLIYGLTYSMYADYGVAIFLLLGVLCQAGYSLLRHPLAEALPLLGVVCSGFGMNVFFLNSYTVWADWYGNFNMYGSQGGVTPVIILLVLMLLTIISGIVACFLRRKGA